ncbi:hypothetical protein EBR66_04035 [bacterium]|nr:hypothetical protein [bacterium]
MNAVDTLQPEEVLMGVVIEADRRFGVSSETLEVLARRAGVCDDNEFPQADFHKIHKAWNNGEPFEVEDVMRRWVTARSLLHLVPDSTRVERWFKRCQEHISHCSRAKYSPISVSATLWALVKSLDD